MHLSDATDGSRPCICFSNSEEIQYIDSISNFLFPFQYMTNKQEWEYGKQD